MMTGKTLDWKKSCRLHFGAYAQVHEERNMSNTLEERTQGAICIGPYRQPTGHIQFILPMFWKKNTRGQFTEVPTSMIVMKLVVVIALAKKQNEGLIFENRTGATVNDILPDDEANEAFGEIDRNITGMEWEAEAETQEPVTHTPQTYNNQYVVL